MNSCLRRIRERALEQALDIARQHGKVRRVSRHHTTPSVVYVRAVALYDIALCGIVAGRRLRHVHLRTSERMTVVHQKVKDMDSQSEVVRFSCEAAALSRQVLSLQLRRQHLCYAYFTLERLTCTGIRDIERIDVDQRDVPSIIQQDVIGIQVADHGTGGMHVRYRQRQIVRDDQSRLPCVLREQPHALAGAAGREDMVLALDQGHDESYELALGVIQDILRPGDGQYAVLVRKDGLLQHGQDLFFHVPSGRGAIRGGSEL